MEESPALITGAHLSSYISVTDKCTAKALHFTIYRYHVAVLSRLVSLVTGKGRREQPVSRQPVDCIHSAHDNASNKPLLVPKSQSKVGLA